MTDWLVWRPLIQQEEHQPCTSEGLCSAPWDAAWWKFSFSRFFFSLISHAAFFICSVWNKMVLCKPCYNIFFVKSPLFSISLSPLWMQYRKKHSQRFRSPLPSGLDELGKSEVKPPSIAEALQPKRGCFELPAHLLYLKGMEKIHLSKWCLSWALLTPQSEKRCWFYFILTP